MSFLVNSGKESKEPSTRGGLSGGPEGIRTPGLLSAIEARSQLRYRPNYKATDILPEANRDVKQTFDGLRCKIGASYTEGTP